MRAANKPDLGKPLAPSADGGPDPAPAPPEEAAGHSAAAVRRVLLVDDDAMSRGVARAMLERAGVAVTEAEDGIAALDALGRTAFDVVVTDVLMPRMDGYRLCFELRRRRVSPAPAVMVLSGVFVEAEDESLLRELGVSHLLRKPASPEELRSVLAARRGGLAPLDAAEELALFERYSRRIVERLADKNRELARANAALREKSARLQAIIATEPECVKVVDRDGALLEMNPAGLAMLDAASLEEVRARPLIEFVAPSDREAFARFHRCSLRGEPGQLEFQVVGLRGSRRTLETHAVPLRDEAGEVHALLAITRDVTEKRAAEQRLRLLSEAVAQSQSSVLIASPSGKIEYVNRALIERTGYAEAELIGANPRLFKSGFTTPEVYRDLWSTITAGRVWRGELLNRKKGGELFWEDTVISPVRDAAGQIAHFVAIKHDNTEHKLAIDALRDSREHYRSLFENMLEGYVLCQIVPTLELPADLLIVEANPAVAKVTGLTDVVGRKAEEVVPGLHGLCPELLAVCVRVAREGAQERLELLVPPLRRWFSIAVFCPEPGHVAMVFDDITPRKEAERAVQRSNRELWLLGACNESLVHAVDERALLERVCADIVALGQHDAAWVVLTTPGRPEAAIVVNAADSKWTERAEIGAALATVVRTGRPAVVRANEGGDGGALVLLPLVSAGDHLGALVVADRRLTTFDTREIAFLTDLAADVAFGLAALRARAEAARAADELRASEERFRRLIENASDVIAVVDATGAHRFLSPAVERVLGMGPAELLVRNLFELVHPEDRERVRGAVAEARQAAPPVRVEYRLRHRDGTWRTLEAIGRSIPWPDGTEAVVLTSRDVTEQRALEMQLRQAQKMDAVGQLSGGVAHDFNNLLTIITANVFFLQQDGVLLPEQAGSLQQIAQAAGRAATLTRQLLAFSRKQALQLREVDLTAVVAEMTELLRPIRGENIELRLAATAAPLPVCADTGMIQQVLLNLVVNARDAMPRGGRLTIETARRTIDQLQPGDPAGLAPGEFACLSVQDTGEGIPPETLPRIFEPFFTTKPAGQGTGLGLATVHGIVQQHRGCIRLTSEVGKGTEFRIYFPLAAPAAAAPAPVRGAVRKSVRGTERILVVEDDAIVRAVVSNVLGRCGYAIVEAATGGEALAVCRRREQKIDLVLTDLILPEGMTGVELGRALARECPGLPVIFASGYSAEAAGRNPGLKEGENFLSKPFDLERLTRVVRARLDEATGGARP